MKRIVLILLAAFLLCTLIIFSTACENHQEQPAMQIELAVNSACRVEKCRRAEPDVPQWGMGG